MDKENYKNINDLKAEIEHDFAPITPYIYSSLEYAYQIVPEVFKQISERSNYTNQFPGKAAQINKWLYASLIRGITQYVLNIYNLKTKSASPNQRNTNQTDWECEILSNNGLEGTQANRTYKILKALKVYEHDEFSDETKTVIKIPPPGHSKRRKKYLRQEHRLQSVMNFSGNGKVILPKHNALYLWDFVSNSLNLYLACSQWCSINTVTPYFIYPVPHPITTIEATIESDNIIEDIELPKFDFGQVPNLNEEEQDANEED